MAINAPIEVESFTYREPTNTIFDAEESEISSDQGSRWIGFGINFRTGLCDDSVIKDAEVCEDDQAFNDCTGSFGTADTIPAWRAQWAASCNPAQLVAPGEAEKFLSRIKETHVNNLHKTLASGFWDRVLSRSSIPIGNVLNPSPAAAVAIVYGIAMLIQSLSQQASGAEGVLHMSPFVAAIASAKGILYRNGRVLRTVVGNHLVIADGGYNGDGPDYGVGDESATASTQWVYATGPVRYKVSDTVFPAGFDIKEYFKKESNAVCVPVETFMIAYFDPCQWFAVNVDLFKDV